MHTINTGKCINLLVKLTTNTVNYHADFVPFQSELKKLNCCKSRGSYPSDIAGTANDERYYWPA